MLLTLPPSFTLLSSLQRLDLPCRAGEGDPVSVNSLYGQVQACQRALVTGPDLSVFNPDGSTLGTLPLTVTPGADPITGVG